AFAGYGLFRTFKPSGITRRNIKNKLRDWLEAYGLNSHQITPTPPECHFGREVILPSQVAIWIVRTNQHDRYLTLSINATPHTDQRNSFNALSATDRMDFCRGLFFE